MILLFLSLAWDCSFSVGHRTVLSQLEMILLFLSSAWDCSFSVGHGTVLSQLGI